MSAAIVASLYGLVRHALARLIRGLGARSAARACLTAATRAEWQEIADDVRALARHDNDRQSYPLASLACEAMGRGTATEAIDLLLELTGDDLAEWMARASEAQAEQSGSGACGADCARLDAVVGRLAALRAGWVRSGRPSGETEALREIEAALDGASS